MYKTEFTKFNGIMNKIMDEQTTLEVHLSAEFSQNIPKEYLKYTPDEWAKYAFENDAEYSINYYKNNKPYCQVSIDDMSIIFDYYNDNNLKTILRLVFAKGEIIKGEFELFTNNKVFLKQITWHSELAKSLLFYLSKNKDNVLLKEWIREDGKTFQTEQKGTADLSKNWFDTPKNYLDYERFLDYKELFSELPTV